jgi:hypothetical protein
LQSVSEFYVAVTRKRLVRQSEASAQAYDWLEMFSTVAPSANAIRAAITSTGEALPSAVLTLLSED